MNCPMCSQKDTSADFISPQDPELCESCRVAVTNFQGGKTASEQTNTGERPLKAVLGDQSIVDVKTKEDIQGAKRYGGWVVYDFIMAMNLNFPLGNAVKYIARAGKKDGALIIDDLKKARTYIDKHIEDLEKEKK